MELTHHNLHTNPDISFTTSVYGAVPKATVNSHQAEQGSTAQYTTTPDYGYTGTTGGVPGSSYSYTVDTKGIYESPYRKAATGAGDIVFGTQSSYSSYKPSDVTTQASGSSQPKETIPASYSSHVPNQEANAVPVSYGTGNLYLGESYLNFATSVDGTSNHADYARLGSIKPWNTTNPSTVEPYTTTIVNHNLDNLIGTPASYITKQASQVSPSGGDAGYRPSIYSQQTEVAKRSIVNVQSVPSVATQARGSILAPYRNSMYPEFELVQDLPDRSNLYESMNYLLKQSTERESLLAPPVGVSINRNSALSPADIKFQRLLKEKYEDGSIYEGESQNGLAHGKGKLIYIDGRSFVGEFSHGKAQGKGVFYFKNGQVWYEGDVFDFVFEGKGVLKCENPVPIQKSVEVEDFGSIGNYWVKYEGEFKGGKKNGNGVLHFTNGDKFTGEFKGDKIHGKGVFEQKDVKVVKGVWEDNKLKQRN